MSTNSINVAPPSAENAAEALFQEIIEMENLEKSVIPGDKAALKALEDQLAGLESYLSSLEQQLANLPPDANKYNLERAINRYEQAIQDTNGQINAATNKILDDQKELAHDISDISGGFENVSALTGNAIAGADLIDKMCKKAMDIHNDPDYINQEIQKEAAAFSKLMQDTEADALRRLDNITNDQKAIDADEAEEKELQDEINEDAIKAAACYAASWFTFGASLAGAGYFTYKAVEAAKEKAAVEKDEDAKKADLTVQMAALKDDLNVLAAGDNQDLSKEIDDLFKKINQIISLIGNSSGEGDLQKVSSLLAEVMTIIQMITAKVQQIKSKNDQWMDRANTDAQEIATNKSAVSYKSLEALQEYATFMKTVMNVVKVVAMVASVVTAIVSGGTLAIFMAALMVALTASGLLDKATEALAEKLSSSGAVWAKVLADVIVTVISVVLTASVSALASRLGSAGAQAAEEATKEAVEEAVQQVETEIASVAKSAVNDVEEEGEEVANEAIEEVASNVKPSTKVDTGPSALRQGIGQSISWFATNNGIVDLTMLIAAASKGKADKSIEELQQDELFQILALVAALVQAISQFAGAKMAMGNNSEGSGLSKAINKLLDGNIDKLARIIQGIQVVNGLVGAAASGCLASNSMIRGKLLQDLGVADSNTSVYKSLGKMSKLFEQKQIELFASKLSQQLEETYLMLRKAGEAESEAARILEATAV